MRVDSLSLIQRRIALIERGGRAATEAAGHAPTGHDRIDRALGGGVMRARVHELVAESAAEAGSGAGFVGVLAHRLGGEMIWLRERDAELRQGQLHAPGVAAIGIDPARLLLGVLPDAAAVLRAAADAVRCAGLGSVVIELWGNPRAYDLTASRRLALLAEASGVTALLLRVGGAMAPSAAQTRIGVSPAPSVPLAADAPGYPAWTVELQRQRGGPAGGIWRVEWDREHGQLRDQDHDAATLSGAVPSLSGDRPAGAIGATGLRRTG
ncbi:MAG: hypothetical protein B7Z07_01150 [Sphingomonadales bacterium 32-67-7]|nr:MAG: hypothetical protein B7Z07_01150 [Sphingomonadales bacterium 32-67-7]